MRVMILLPDNEADVSANFGGGGRALSTMRVMILYLKMRQMSVPILGGVVYNEGDDSVPDDEADVSVNWGGGRGGFVNNEGDDSVLDYEADVSANILGRCQQDRSHEKTTFWKTSKFHGLIG